MTINYVDTLKLQYALNELRKWADAWQLSISVEKCCILEIVKSCCMQLGPNPTIYSISDHNLPVVKECRDLGVLVVDDLNCEKHIQSIVVKAHQRAGLILRCFVTRDIEVLLKAYKVYVRPVLEYNSTVCNPHLVKHIDVLERVQRCFTKRLRKSTNYITFTVS